MATHQMAPGMGLEAPARNESTDRFVAAMLDMSPTANTRRSPLRLAASVVIHGAILAALIIAPIYLANDAMDLKTMTQTFLVAPPPPAPPPPPAVQQLAKVAPQPTIKVNPFVAPKVIPKTVEIAKDEAPPVSADAGVAGGVEGGVSGGVLGGVLGGEGTGPAAPKVETPAVVRVGGNVKPPQLLSKVDPVYPPIAKAAKVSGAVQIDAVIDTDGNVVRAHAVGGSGLLIPAALAAVDQWKFAPTYLNGQPVSVAMQVTVQFRLGHTG